jgi:ribonucleoside-diphosphate reductase alpha subunit
MCNGLSIDPVIIAQKICGKLYNGVTTCELDTLTSQTCMNMVTDNMEYATLGSRIAISNHHKSTDNTLIEVMNKLYMNYDTNGVINHLINDDVYAVVQEHSEYLESIIDYNKDYNIDFFGFKTLERAYLLKINKKVIERPQHLFMRVSLGLWGTDLDNVTKSYQMLSEQYFIHATPTLFHCGTPRQGMISCFLLGTDDSIEGIYKNITDCAKISKWAGGIGIHVSNIRSKNTQIRGTNGISSGIIPMCRVYNETMKYVNQCFTPDTMLYSKRGPLCCEAICEGDELITRDGSYKRVNTIFKSDKHEKILSFKSLYSINNIKCTKKHEILIVKAGDFNKNKSEPVFVTACDIKAGDYVGYAIPTYSNNLKISNDDSYLAGIVNMYGVHVYGNVFKFCPITIRYNDINISLESYFNSSHIDFTDNNGIYEVTFDNNYYVDNLYDEISDNKIHCDILNMPIKRLYHFISGMLANIHIKITNDIICINTDSLKLVYDMRYVFLRIHTLISCKLDEMGGYIIQIPLTRLVSKIIGYPYFNIDFDYGFHKYNGMLYTMIIDITEIEYKGEVYDFNMIDNHNYMTELGIVHNSGKRNGSAAMYLEPHHPDIMSFLDLRKNHGNEDDRTRDLFLALWISDLFMQTVEANGNWYLLDPDRCPGLNDCYGEEYSVLYNKYVSEGRYTGMINARDIWTAITVSQIETGTPYILYKDAVNRKSNQKNYGVIKSSNLCAEIVEYSDKDEYACCVLASIGLPKYIENGEFNFDKMINVCDQIVRNLNRVIDNSYYPVPETSVSNMRHRPLGIGVQGLADVFNILRIPFDSVEARELNKQIFESIYYGCIKASIEEAKLHGTYESFQGSPISQGQFQFDLWGVEPSDRYNWDELRADIAKYGIRNSLLTAMMPTASTSQIMGNNECFEAYTSNIYLRQTLAGDFIVINKYLINDLNDLGLWNSTLKDEIILNNGSVQNIDEIPDDIKQLYKTVWEIKQKVIIDMAADRGPYVCQTQSMNLFFEEPTNKIMYNALMYAWKKGLKTGVYYTRSQPKAQAQKFTIDPNFKKNKQSQAVAFNTQLEACESCSA